MCSINCHSNRFAGVPAPDVGLGQYLADAFRPGWPWPGRIGGGEWLSSGTRTGLEVGDFNTRRQKVSPIVTLPDWTATFGRDDNASPSPSFQARPTGGKKPMNDARQISQQRASAEGTWLSASLRAAVHFFFVPFREFIGLLLMGGNRWRTPRKTLERCSGISVAQRFSKLSRPLVEGSWASCL